LENSLLPARRSHETADALRHARKVTKKNPKQVTRLGFLSCCLNLGFLAGQRGVGGWGAARSALWMANRLAAHRCNADHALVSGLRQKRPTFASARHLAKIS
jgi:hypothetical protein